MEIEKITATYSDKRQLEQFEPVEMSTTFEASLAEGDDPEECYEELMEMAKSSVGGEIVRRISEWRMEDDIDSDR